MHCVTNVHLFTHKLIPHYIMVNTAVWFSEHYNGFTVMLWGFTLRLNHLNLRWWTTSFFWLIKCNHHLFIIINSHFLVAQSLHNCAAHIQHLNLNIVNIVAGSLVSNNLSACCSGRGDNYTIKGIYSQSENPNNELQTSALALNDLLHQPNPQCNIIWFTLMLVFHMLTL